MTEHEGLEHSGAERNRRRVLIISLVAAVVLIVAGTITGVTLMNMNNDADTSGGDRSGDTAHTQTAEGAGTAERAGTAEGADANGTESAGGAAEGLRNDASQVLPRAMSGQEAIDALGDDIEIVADRNGMSVEALTETLLKNPSAKVSKNGFLMFP